MPNYKPSPKFNTPRRDQHFAEIPGIKERQRQDPTLYEQYKNTRTIEAWHENKPYTMFEVPYLLVQISPTQKKQLLDLYNAVDKEPERWIEYDGVSPMRTDYFKTKKESYSNVIQRILWHEIDRVRTTFGMREPFIHNAWFQSYSNGGFHAVHNHGFGFSAVCYLKYDPRIHRPTRFIAPFNDFASGHLVEFEPQNGTLFGVKEGSIIFFPSSIHHYCLPSFVEDEDSRMILAFDLKETTSYNCGVCRDLDVDPCEGEEHY